MNLDRRPFDLPWRANRVFQSLPEILGHWLLQSVRPSGVPRDLSSERARAARISLAATSDVHLSIFLSLRSRALSCHARSLHCPMFSAKATEEGFNHPETINRRQSLEEKWTELAEITAQRPRLSEKFLHNSSITLPGQGGRWPSASFHILDSLSICEGHVREYRLSRPERKRPLFTCYPWRFRARFYMQCLLSHPGRTPPCSRTRPCRGG